LSPRLLTVAWEKSAADFVDRLVESDVRYVNLQAAIEHILHACADDLALVSDMFLVDGEPFYAHRFPSFFPEMPTIWAFFRVLRDQIDVCDMKFDG
jgi:hypothetical protein